MKAFTIENVKLFMNSILKEKTFDHFLLCEAEIRGKAALELDGRIPEQFYSEEELASLRKEGGFVPYGSLRNLCFEAVRGSHTPAMLKVVFAAPRSYIARILEGSGADPEKVQGFYMNILFRGGQLTVTTGISMREFTPDREAEDLWDRFVGRLLNQCNISYTKMA